MKKNFRFGDARLFVASALVATGVMLPFEAGAGWRTQHASACQVIDQGDLSYWDGTRNNKTAVGLPAGGWDPASERLRLNCPVSDDSDFSKQNAIAGVSLYQAGPNASTQWNACVSYENAIGGSCGNTNVAVGGTGISTTTIVSPAWNTRSHYAYIYVALGSKHTATDPPNMLQGYFFQN
jgi:hypothetical protein